MNFLNFCINKSPYQIHVAKLLQLASSEFSFCILWDDCLLSTGSLILVSSDSFCHLWVILNLSLFQASMQFLLVFLVILLQQLFCSNHDWHWIVLVLTVIFFLLFEVRQFLCIYFLWISQLSIFLKSLNILLLTLLCLALFARPFFSSPINIGLFHSNWP